MNRLRQAHWSDADDAFNPVTLNVAGMALAAIAWLTRTP